ncbi:unnamed protein product [Linum trigynum]|uniref:Uncharacterized protein n=1 Tax=Linum trigynum TaxID=586398 RepID=A0AAV2CXR9_9ROSI
MNQNTHGCCPLVVYLLPHDQRGERSSGWILHNKRESKSSSRRVGRRGIGRGESGASIVGLFMTISNILRRSGSRIRVARTEVPANTSKYFFPSSFVESLTSKVSFPYLWPRSRPTKKSQIELVGRLGNEGDSR